ncbi:hypothetical protein Bcep18194_B2841 [Burkholderia lata]|uniref:Uncharacterized protein n=1 Tax=Burkholderia lata (strain ATCC 17760 / DSM 23089 / LMG 22485 / NCIMB 9086 / R18194 / 383) TaxID=482957 RepID=Q391B4_BURL3|nr:hypothetical protein Bcep18194_B2841 [Burkholderia lata]
MQSAVHEHDHEFRAFRFARLSTGRETDCSQGDERRKHRECTHRVVRPTTIEDGREARGNARGGWIGPQFNDRGASYSKTVDGGCAPRLHD